MRFLIALLALTCGVCAWMPDLILHWRFGNAWAVRLSPCKLMGRGDIAQTLVNLENDIGEKNNLLNEKPELAKNLMKMHRQWGREVGSK